MSEIADAVALPAIPAVLGEAGVAGAAEAAAARLQDLSRSHAVTLAELPDGSAYVVKCVSRQALEAGRSLAAELFAYRLASWRPELAAVLPEPVLLDEANQVVVLAAGHSENLLPARYLDPGFPSPQLAAALGASLAVVHAQTDGMTLPIAASCGVVQLPDADPEEWQIAGGSAAARTLAEAVVADERLVSALRHTAAALRPTCLVHADVKWDNALLLPGPPARALLFDWELSGAGDPAWDLGSALADTVVLGLRVHGSSSLAEDPVDWFDPSLRALLGAYGTNAGDDLADRVAGCWASRTVHLALECAASLEAADDPAVADLLGLARRLAGHHDAVAATVDGALGARA